MTLLCVMLLVFSGCMNATSEYFRVVGPAAPLAAVTGDELILPCSLQPNISAEDMMVEWTRADLTDTLVHLYEGRKDQNDKQMKSYSGRTALFKEELYKGNASLKLTALQPSDEGVYQCVIKSESFYDDISVHVKVRLHLKVLGPAVPVVVEAGDDLVLPCFLKPSISAEDMTVVWIRLPPTDKLVHLYENYEDRNEKQNECYKGRTCLFKEELKKGNTSLKVSAVQLSDEGAYKCSVQYGSWHDDITVYAEVKEIAFHAWKIAVICISVFAIILIAFTACIVKDKFSEKMLSPKQCSFVTYMRLSSEHVKKEFDLKTYNTTDEGYRRLIRAITNYKKARFAGCNLTAESMETLVAALQSANSLKELDLTNSQLQDSGVELLSVGMNGSHCKLEILRLAMCKLSELSCDALRSVIQSETSSLKELDLSKNDLQDSGVERLSAGLKSSYCKLETLRLAICKLGKESCDALRSALQTETASLKVLDLSDNDLQDSGVELLSAGLKSSYNKLESLRLALCNLGKISCENLGSVLQLENSSLIELDLSNNDLQDSGVELLSAGLKSSHCKLQILQLALCNLGENTCENLGSVLKLETSSLKELDLSNNDLQDSGVKQLSAGLSSSHCKLQILRLSGCMVTAEGCSSLASALSSNPLRLKELDLTYNQPGESGIKLLTARLEDPHCTLRVDYAGRVRIKKGLKKYACELTLDPNTAHTRLSLSERNTKVMFMRKRELYPDHPERFDFHPQVMCRESLTGRCYWEAEWRVWVAISVTYKRILRKGDVDGFGFNEKSWTLICSDDECIARHITDTCINPPVSKRIGVYLDYQAGTLSFYSISSEIPTRTHLHTFYTTFTDPVYAGFGFQEWDVDCSVHLCEID